MIGWRAIFVALLVYILAVQPTGGHPAAKAHASGPSTPRTPAAKARGQGRTNTGGGQGTQGLFKGTGHKLGCE